MNYNQQKDMNQSYFTRPSNFISSSHESNKAETFVLSNNNLLHGNPYESDMNKDQLSFDENKQLSFDENKQIDVLLDQISDGLERLKYKANNINDELIKSTDIIIDITANVDDTDGNLININKKVKKMLSKNKDTLCICFIIILLISLVIILGYLLTLI